MSWDISDAAFPVVQQPNRLQQAEGEYDGSDDCPYAKEQIFAPYVSHHRILAFQWQFPYDYLHTSFVQENLKGVYFLNQEKNKRDSEKKEDDFNTNQVRHPGEPKQKEISSSSYKGQNKKDVVRPEGKVDRRKQNRQCHQ